MTVVVHRAMRNAELGCDLLVDQRAGEQTLPPTDKGAPANARAENTPIPTIFHRIVNRT